MLSGNELLAILHAVPVPAIVLLPDAPHFTIAAVNDQYLDVSYRNREELLGRRLFDMFPENPDDPQADGIKNLTSSLMEVIKSGEVNNMPLQRYDITTPDSTGYQERYWLPKNIPVKDEDGKVSYILHVVENATSRVLAEKSAEAGEQLFRSAFEHSAIGMALQLPNGRYKEVNESLCEILGYRKDEMLKLRFTDLTHPEDIETDMRMMNMLAKGHKDVLYRDKRYRHKSGHDVWVSLCVSAVRSDAGQVSYFVIQAQDITEQMKIKAALQRSTQHYKSLFEQNPDPVFSLDLRGYFTTANNAAVKLSEYRREELLRTHFTSLCVPDDADRIQGYFSECLNGKAFGFEMTKVTATGRMVDLMVTVMPIFVNGVIEGIYGIAKDVTERKALEREIHRQQRQFASLFEEAPVSMSILKGPELVFESANALYYKFTGKKDIVGKRVREVFPEVYGQGYFEKLEHVYTSGETLSEPEAAIQMQDESSGALEEKYMNYMLQPYFGANGNIEGIFYFGLDVTEQVRARKKIEESERRYVDLIENLPVALFTTDAEGRIMLYNKSAVSLWGRQPEVGKDKWCHSWEIFSPDFSPLPPEKCPASVTLRTGKAVRGQDIIIRRPTGDYRHILPHPSPIWNAEGMLTGIMNVLIDITERKKAEEELEKLSLIARKTVNAVLITDLEGKIEWVNDAFTRITEYTFEEAMGRTAASLLHGRGTESTIKALKEEMYARRQPFECEMLKYTKSGRPFWVEVQIQPLFDAAGKPVRFFEIETDVTERKQAYEKLVRAKNATSSFARQLNNVLEEERTRISREMHDEFGQQLSGLKMSLTSLKRHAAGNGKILEIVNGTLSDADHAIQTLRRIVTDLRPGILDTLGLFAAVEWLATEFEKKSGIGCSWSFTGSRDNPDKDVAICFFRICQEALTNIMRHAEASRVTIGMEQLNGVLGLTVTDNGKGLSREIIQNPFSMGLLGMRERANMVGGNLNIESEPGRGTTVELIVPAGNG